MTGFVLAALGLLALALAWVLPGLWRGSRSTALALALLLVAGTAGVYGLVGTPDALDPRNVAQATTLEEAIAQLERRLVREPASVEGWVLLGRSRMAQQQWMAARDAFAKAHALLPDEPDLMVELADAQLRAASDGRFPASASALLERALAAQPMNQRGLLMLGALRLQSGQPAEAAALWERLLPQLDAAAAQALAPQIAAARAQAGLPAAALEAPAADAQGTALDIIVALSPSVAARVTPGSVLFVFARTAEGSGPPVAVKRLPAADFPVSLQLSDADGLMPAQRLSQQSQVSLMARISRTGDAAAASGDFEAEPLRVDVRDGRRASLLVDRVVP